MTTQPPYIGACWPGSKDLYAGVMRAHCAGDADYVLLLGPDMGQPATWTDAMKWATRHRGYALPDRREAALLFANLPEHFKDQVYWTRTNLAETGYPALAYQQNFGNGMQDFEHIHHPSGARIVRRMPLVRPHMAQPTYPILKLVPGHAIPDYKHKTTCIIYDDMETPDECTR